MNRLSAGLVLALAATTALAQSTDTAVQVHKSRVLLVPAPMVNAFCMAPNPRSVGCGMSAR